MVRTLATNFSTNLEGEMVSVGFFFDFNFDSGTVYIWNGNGTVNTGGNDYLGTGQMGSISGVAEDAGLKDVDIVVELSGIENADFPDLLGELRDQDVAGRTFTVYMGLFDANNDLIDGLETITDGIMDGVDITVSASGGKISLRLANDSRLLGRVQSYRYACEPQQSLFAGDTAFCTKPKNQDAGGGGRITLGGRLSPLPPSVVRRVGK